MIIAVLLVLVGAGGYLAAHPDPATGHVSPTALIPAGIGIILGILGAISMNPKARKHAMHVAALVGLLSIGGVAARLPKTISELSQTPGTSPLKLGSMLATVVLCIAFLGLCIRSFVQARIARKAGEKQ